MAYEQVQDILKRTREHHRRVRHALEHAEPDDDRQRADALLAEVQREESAMEALLEGYRGEGPDNVLETWIQYVEDEDVSDALQSLQLDSGASIEEIMTRKAELDDALAEYYAQLRDQVSAPKVQELFSSLHELIARRKEQAAWSVLEDG